MVAAELQTSRNFDQMSLKDYTSSFLTAARIQVTGWWQGAQFGLVSFISAAAFFNCVKFGSYAVAQKCWGLHKDATPVRQAAALRDMGSFKSS